VAWVLLQLFAFTIPWEYSLDLGEPLGNIARLFGLLLLLALVPAVLQAGRIRTPGTLQWLVLALFAWFCLSCFWSGEPQETFRHLRGYVQELMIVWLVWELAETPEHVRDLLRAYVAGAWVLAALTIATFAFAATSEQVRFVAEGQDPNDAARFLDLGLPVAALLLGSERKWGGRLLAFCYLPLGMLGVLLTASRSGFLAALVALAGCGILLFHRRRRGLMRILFVSPLIIGALWFTVPRQTMERIASIPEQLQGGNLNQRWDIWAAGWQAFVHAPFLGSGAGSFASAAGLAPVDTAHNTALALLVEGGVFALGIAAAIVVASIHCVLRTYGPLRIALAASLMVWLVSSMVATVQENRTTWLLLGVIAVAARVTTEKPAAMAGTFSGDVEQGTSLHPAVENAQT
jgi:O-antigen ligase